MFFKTNLLRTQFKIKIRYVSIGKKKYIYNFENAQKNVHASAFIHIPIAGTLRTRTLR